MTTRALVEPFAGVDARAWIVGGALRDVLIGRSIGDVDVAVDGDARRLATDLARRHRGMKFPLSDRFGAWRVHGGTLPFSVDLTPLQGPDLASDLARRDLTINAMALAISGRDDLVDPHGGRADVLAGVIRAVGPDAFRSDPVRVLRAARLAHTLPGRLTDETEHLARASAPALWDTSAERLRDELYRVTSGSDPAGAFRGLDRLGALGVLVPELEDARGMSQSAYHHLDVLGHTLEVVEHVATIAADPATVFRANGDRVATTLSEPLADDLSRREALVLAALLHDMAKPATRGVLPGGRVTFMGHDRVGAEQADRLLERLHVAGRVRALVTALVRNHLKLGFMVHSRPHSLRQMDRYLRSTAPGEVEQLVLSVADRLATNGPRTTPNQIDKHLDLARAMLATHVDLLDRGPIAPAIRGDELARRLGRPAGPWLAPALEHLREIQLTRPLTPDTAERMAREYLDKHI
ncbi:MAG: HD domain-containing protein [Thermoleophilia bacterium]|nr:HD domain-containing protein [Thermoleophilia bacterium]